jgi:hypothetical protein
MMSALICGSMAYDTIMVFHDKLKNHINGKDISIKDFVELLIEKSIK